MLISTRGRYALRVMIDLAEHYTGGYIPMKDVAARQELSLKYIERIMPELTKSGCVEGVHGKGGGYRLCRAPRDYTAWEILSLVEGGLAPVSCLDEGVTECEMCDTCETLEVWKKLYDAINDVIDNVTVADLVAKRQQREGSLDYCI